MPRTRIERDGRIVYRTRLMEYDRARAFEKCLRANASRFAAVELQQSDQATGLRCCYLTFQPVNPDCALRQVDCEQNKRTAKALDEGAAYLFMLDCDGRAPFYWVFNPKSGETYQTTYASCSCPDFCYRLSRCANEIRCKHIERLRLAVAASDLMSLAAAYDTPEWRAAHPCPRPAGWRPPAVVNVPIEVAIGADEAALPIGSARIVVRAESLPSYDERDF